MQDNFLIGFLDELGNFKQKKITFQNAIFFLHFTAIDPMQGAVVKSRWNKPQNFIVQYV